jgi:hypothetical protein
MLVSMSDNPDDTAVTPPADTPPPAAPKASTPIHRHRAFPLVLVGLAGLLIGCLIGGTVVGLVAAVHGDRHHGDHMRYDDRGPRFDKRGEQPVPGFPKRLPQKPIAPAPDQPVPAPSATS